MNGGAARRARILVAAAFAAGCARRAPPPSAPMRAPSTMAVASATSAGAVSASAVTVAAPEPSAAPVPVSPPDFFALGEDAGREGSCRFGGVVESIEETAAFARFDAGGRPDNPYRALRIRLGDPSRACGEAGSTTLEAMAVGRPRFAPHSCTRIVIGVPEGWTLPIAAGDSVCGSVAGFSIGYGIRSEVFVVDAADELVFAFSPALPRTSFQRSGWTFELGGGFDCRRTGEDSTLCSADVTVRRGGAQAKFHGAGAVRLAPKSGPAYRVSADGYRFVAGGPAVWYSIQGLAGFSLTIARER